MKRIVLAAMLAASPALAVLNELPGDDPDLAQGEQAVRTGRYELGIPFLRAALERFPEQADIHVYLALALRQTGRAEEAARHYEHALRSDPTNLGALAYQGVLFLAQGNRAAAEANMARLRDLCPNGCVERDELARELARVAAR